MKTQIYFLISAILLFACQPQSPQLEEKLTEVSTDSTQYFRDLDSVEILKAMIYDSIPDPKKVIVKSLVISSMSAWTGKDETQFYNIAGVFPYHFKDKKPQNAVVVIAEYHGEKIGNSYEIMDDESSGPTLFYGIYAYKENKGWYLQKKCSKDFVERFWNFGYNGVMGDIDLVQVGKDQYGLALSSYYSGQGYESEGITFYDIGQEREIFGLSETTSNSGAVENEDEAYAFSFLCAFIPSDKDFFDMQVTYEGTHDADSEDDDSMSKVEPFKKTVRYSYDKISGKYVENQ